MNTYEPAKIAPSALKDGMKVDKKILKDIFLHPSNYKNKQNKQDSESQIEISNHQSALIHAVLEIENYISQNCNEKEILKHALQILFSRFNAYGVFCVNNQPIIKTSDFNNTLEIDLATHLEEFNKHITYHWNNEDFQKENKNLIYPYIDGEKKLGFVALNISNKITKDEGECIIALLTSLTGTIKNLSERVIHE